MFRRSRSAPRPAPVPRQRRTTTRQPLTPDQVDDFLSSATERQRRQTVHRPEQVMGDPFWRDINDLLEILEHDNPVKVRMCREAFRWLYAEAYKLSKRR